MDVRRRLLEWYRTHRRDLPWRRLRDPYAIWVSEIMLQQTRVDTVIPYFERFLDRWPTVKDLAAADPDDVRAAWSGLGYYRRAKLMMQAAQVVATEHDGQFPSDLDDLHALPGFGRYTAGAVASIAFDVPAAAVDGNVARVLARLAGIRGDISRGEPLREVWAIAETLAPGEAPGEHTQAMIELGALICGKRPKCLLCPVREACIAKAEGLTEVIPPPRRKPRRSSVELTALIWCTDSQVLLTKQPDDGLFAGLWTPPTLSGSRDPEDVRREIQQRHGWRVEAEYAGDLKHVLTHRDLFVRLVRLSGSPSAVSLPWSWSALDQLESLGLPSLTVKALRKGLRPEDLSGLNLPGRRASRRS